MDNMFRELCSSRRRLEISCPKRKTKAILHLQLCSLLSCVLLFSRSRHSIQLCSHFLSVFAPSGDEIVSSPTPHFAVCADRGHGDCREHRHQGAQENDAHREPDAGLAHHPRQPDEEHYTPAEVWIQDGLGMCVRGSEHPLAAGQRVEHPPPAQARNSRTSEYEIPQEGQERIAKTKGAEPRKVAKKANSGVGETTSLKRDKKKRARTKGPRLRGALFTRC